VGFLALIIFFVLHVSGLMLLQTLCISISVDSVCCFLLLVTTD